MRKQILLIVALILNAIITIGQGSLGFNYQAVIRNTSGQLVSNQAVDLRISIIKDNTTGVVLYTETFDTETNDFGQVAIVVGTGTATLGEFDEIDWATGIFFMKVEVALNGTKNFMEMGTTQLLSVPFANYAFSSPGTKAWTDGNGSVSTQKKVGVGVDTPGATLVVQRIGEVVEDVPIFEVKNSLGETVFAVYEDGVRMYVNDEVGEKSEKSGFAIGGLTGQKVGKESTEYFRVTPDSVRMFIRETISKNSKGGFAIGGYTGQKLSPVDLLYVSPSYTRINIDPSSSKSDKSGFAIGGFSGQKEGELDFLTIKPSNVRFNILEETGEGKSNKAGFAIGGYSGQKQDTFDMLYVSPQLTNIYIDTTNSSGKSGFAVSGVVNNKQEGYFDMLKVVPERTDIFIKPNAEKNLPEGFSIYGLDESYGATELFVVSEGGTFINTDLAIAPKVTTADAIEIEQTTALLGGEILPYSGSEIWGRGITYSTTPQPSVNWDSFDPSVAMTVWDPIEPPGTGYPAGPFSINLNDPMLGITLKPGVTYYFRAFAQNMEGLIGYGAQKSFITLPPDTITFVVLDADTEAPINNATITFYPSGSAEPIVNPVGNYKVYVAKGTHYYDVSAPGYMETFWQEVEVLENVTETVYLTPQPATAYFHVKDGANNPVESAEIVVVVDGLDNYAMPDEPGVYVVWGVLPGTWDYSIITPGFEDYFGQISVGPGEEVHENVTLTSLPFFTITFKVWDNFTSNEILDAIITVYINAVPTTNPQGNYIFSLQPGEYVYDVIVPGYEEIFYNPLSVIGDAQEDVFLEPMPATVIFTVTDEFFMPVEMATVIITIDGSTGDIWASDMGNGVYEASGVPPGTWDFTINAEGFLQYDGVVTVAPSETKNVDATLTPTPKYTVTINVKQVNGITPSVGADVTLHEPYKGGEGSKFFYQTLTTNALGVVVFELVPEGVYDLEINHFEDGYYYDYGVLINENKTINVTLENP